MNGLPRLWAGLSRQRWLIVVLCISFCINAIGIEWGLPNGNETWAIDSLQPLTPLALVKHAFVDEPWNSGWFYFKYPLGHPFVLAVVQLPYMAWLKVTGEFQTPQLTYPYGFRHPERALTVLALLTRVVSVLMGVGAVGLAYVIASLLFGKSAGLVAAVLVTGCYPIVYFAHTSNVDVPMLFWVALVIAATLVCADHGSRRVAALTGFAAGMALFTKEQSIGVLLAVPFVWFLRIRAHRALQWHEDGKSLIVAGMVFLAVTVVMGNLWTNPMGFVHRWGFLLAALPEEIREKYTPYQFYIQGLKVYSVAEEIEFPFGVAGKVVQLLTQPVALLCLVGAVWTVLYRPRQAALMLLLAASYYVFTLRSFGVEVSPHYTIPLLYFLFILGGAAGGALLDSIRRLPYAVVRQVALALAFIALGGTLLPGIEIDRLIVNDPRYAAEVWLQKHIPVGARIESYQAPTRLPRFAPHVQSVQVPLEERTTESFQQRRPDFVVLSSGAQGVLAARNFPNWKHGEPRFIESEPVKEFFNRLHAEQLGYSRIAHFRTSMGCITPLVGSLNPEITIFARNRVE